ncbi:MAG: LacI family DNA-binding transcriptional regulator [Capsulimonadaceae bacterium]|nr:LacI family DNA-binding transcriptional regulator [Capsulimonadaceae bacterium]
MATIRDVAKLAGVSTATVSRSFRNEHSLKDLTRQRVLDVATQLNYHPHRSAKAVRDASGKTSSMIGFQFFALNEADALTANLFYGPVLVGAQAEAAEIGLHMLLSTTNRYTLEGELPQMVRECAVSGLLLAGTADPAVLSAYLTHVPHIVLVENWDAAQEYDCVISDDFGGAMTATNYLFGLGHKRVGFLTSTLKDVTFQQRLNGYVAAHIQAGIPLEWSRIAAVGSSENAEEHFISGDDIIAHLRSKECPTAFVAVCDVYAVELMRACRKLKISIPHDLSVIGYDDIELGAYVHPTLSTIRVDKEYLGRLAVRRLCSRIERAAHSSRTDPPVRIQLPAKLIERESCAPPKACE